MSLDIESLGPCAALQRDLAHHHGMWHGVPIPDLLIAETALYHGMGVLHLDGDFGRIAEVRQLTAAQTYRLKRRRAIETASAAMKPQCARIRH